jgi:hypothetical protein
VDQNLLVDGGQNLIEALERSGVSLKAAVWVHLAEDEGWRLWLVPANKVDKHAFYRKVAESIAAGDIDFHGLSASDTELIGEDHPAIAALRAYGRVNGRSALRLASTMLNGFYLPEGIVLRMAF